MFDQHTPPLPPKHYIARTEAEAELYTALLSDDDIPLTVLYGESGTGKSALAARVVQELQANHSFPDGVFWINFPDPMFSNTLWKLLCNLNRSFQGTPPLAAGYLQSALWTALDQRKTLFVLDNVPNVQPIREFLCGGVTSTHNEILTVIRARLRRALVEKVNEGELKDLCFDSGIDYDNLPGSGKGDKVRELISYCYRHNCVTKVNMQYRKMRQGETLPMFISGGCRVLAISVQEITDVPLPHDSHLLSFLNEQEALALFQYHMDCHDFERHFQSLREIAHHLKFHPQSIDTYARLFGLGELSPESFLQSCRDGKNTPVSEPFLPRTLSLDTNDYHKITMHISNEELHGLWQKAQRQRGIVGD